MLGKKLTIYINEEIIKGMKKEAIDEDCTLSSLVEKLMREYLNNKKDRN